MADVDVREVASTLLAAIQTEMVQDLQLMQDALQVELDEVSAPQLVRHWSCQSCNNELLGQVSELVLTCLLCCRTSCTCPLW